MIHNVFIIGHLTGKHERHFSISGCPLYHNLSADECKVPILLLRPVVLGVPVEEVQWCSNELCCSVAGEGELS